MSRAATRFKVAWAAAGVIKSGTFRSLRSFDIGGTSGLSINGGREKENEVLLDGITNVRADRTVISVPTTESVQEFKVVTNTYDAQYGRTGGGVIAIVTRGGGNQFHGTAFEYHHNRKLNANQSELNRAGIKKPPNTINQFGAMASGPLYVPKLFDGRNRAFWMLSWESMRQRSADPDVKTFPVMEWRTGDFSTLFNATGQQVLIYDPRSTRADGTRTPIPGNIIPASQIDPVAKAVLAYYPPPRTQGEGPARINNYPYPSRWVASFDQFVGLPFGRGRSFGANVPGLVNQFIGGWQMNWNVTYQSGWVVDYPNAPQVRPGSAKLTGSAWSRTRVFDISLWRTPEGRPVATQEPFTLRTFPYLFSDVRRPGYQNGDTSLSKFFPIREQLRLQFRFEMVNMMNHPWFADMASTDVTNAAFGQLNPTQRNLPRLIKLAMHLYW